jgi:beta-lactamase class A
MMLDDLIHPGIDGCEWGVLARDVETGIDLLSHRPDAVMQAASVGKLVLLGAIAALADDEQLDMGQQVDCTVGRDVADSGLLQHLNVETLSIADLATLVFACSDNAATNLLIDHLRLDRIRELRLRLGFAATDLLDRVRDVRTAEHAHTLSIATADELVGFMTAVWSGSLVSPAASQWMLNGLRLDNDLSLVPATLGLDPLSHTIADPDRAIANKTGTDAGIRADSGLLTHRGRTAAYAVLCNFDPNTVDSTDVITAMHRIGSTVTAALGAVGI